MQTSWTSGLVIASAMAVALGALSALGAAHAQGPVVSTAPGVARSVTPAAAPEVNPHLVAVEVTLGGRALLGQATVRVLDGEGRTLQSTRSLSGGLALFDRRKLTGAASVVVTGGTSSVGNVANNGVLRAPIHVHPTEARITYVSPVSTVAWRVADAEGISYARALRKVRAHTEIPAWAKAYHDATLSYAFHHDAFARFVRESGGVKQALRTMVREVRTQAPHRTFKANPTTASRGLTSWMAEQVIDAVVEGSTGNSVQDLIGSVFGLSEPSSSQTEVLDQIEQLETDIAELQDQMPTLLQGLNLTTYDVLVGDMSSVTGNTANNFSTYKTLVSNDLDDTKTIASFVNGTGSAGGWLSQVYDNFGQWNMLFQNGSGGDGVLKQLYSMNASDNPWWDDSIVSKIDSVVQYWATQYAASTVLVAEAMYFNSQTYGQQSVKVWVGSTASPQSTAIFQSAPTAVSQGQVVDPSSGTIYKLAPASATGATLSYAGSGAPSQPASCSRLGMSYTFPGGIIVPSSTVAEWWTNAAPPGWSVSSTSAFSALQKTRSMNGVTQNALLMLASGDTRAWAVVTSESVPYLGGYYEPKIVDGQDKGDLYFFTGWLWCGSNTVTLVGVEGNPTQWTENFAMSPGSYVPTGDSVTVNSSIPVGVLVQQKGNFAAAVPTTS